MVNSTKWFCLPGFLSKTLYVFLFDHPDSIKEEVKIVKLLSVFQASCYIIALSLKYAFISAPYSGSLSPVNCL